MSQPPFSYDSAVPDSGVARSGAATYGAIAPPPLPQFSVDELAECGWRYQTVTLDDGSTEERMVPLTEADFLHPQEDDHLPNSTFHDQNIRSLKDILVRRYALEPTVGVYGDLLVDWQRDDLKDHCADVFVAFGVSDRAAFRTRFRVLDEGTRPALVIEVVSPRYRKADREIKVEQYARAEVQEYLILDRRIQRGLILEEVLGYRLVQGSYLPISPDDDGRIYLATVDLSIGLQEQAVVVVDGTTGQRLLTAQELEQQVEQERLRAEQERLRAERLAEILRAQGIDPDQV